MNLPVPVVGQEAGPEYALDINSCLSLLDAHDHSAGSGVPITPSGLNISSDLPLNNNNLTAARSLRLQTQAALLSLPVDLGCLYRSGVDLYYNDGSGNQVRITQSGGVAGSPGSISNLVAPASASYVSGSKTFVWQSDASTPANLDAASILLRNLVASSKALTLAPPNAMGADYSLVLPSLPVAQNIMTLDASGNMGAAWNVDNSTLEVASNSIRVKNLGITTAKLADASVTQIKKAAMPAVVYPSIAGAGEIAISPSTTNRTDTSPTVVLIVSVQITTTGRPVRIQLASDATGNSSYLSSTGAAFETYFYRDSVTEIYRSSVSCGSFNDLGPNVNVRNGAIPSSAFSTIDYSLPAGTYTYSFGVAATSGGTVSTLNAVLIAYEL